MAKAPAPIPQPLCESCRFYDGGSCPLLRSVLDLHGQQPVVDCSHREPATSPITTTGDESPKETA